jgi:hypothetical protein
MPMKIFRNTIVRNILALFTGIIFLNMSFFLYEVTVLGLGKNKQMAANIAKLLSTSASEEERDAFAGGADEDAKVKEVDLIFSYDTHSLSVLASKANAQCATNMGIPLLGSYEIYSPPPEA